jgi:transcription initiation factor TFIIIB Brf1 subunit/transcription initiation factor TFIIB
MISEIDTTISTATNQTCGAIIGDIPIDSSHIMVPLQSVSELNIDKILSNMRNITDNFYSNTTDVHTKFVNNNATAEPIIVDYKICIACKTQSVITDAGLLCLSCGLEKPMYTETPELFSETINNNYNTSSNSYISFSVIGANAYTYNRSFIKTCSDYIQYRNNNNKKDIFNRIYQHAGNHPPTNIINATIELFDIIKQKNYIYRGSIKWGVISACLYYMSIEHKVARTPKEIIKIMDIDDKSFGVGHKILLELKELGVVDIQTDYSPLNDYLNQFFPSLGIPDKYKQFVVDLITRMQLKKCHVGNESRLSTKVIGCIYILTLHMPELRHITRDDISRECNGISKSTFIRYHDLIKKNYKLVKKTFKYHHIHQPSSWRE